MKKMTRSVPMLFFLLALTACNNGSSSSPSGAGRASASPKVEIGSVSEGGCLNLEKLSVALNRPDFSHPASMITTNFIVPERMIETNKQFYAAAALDHVQKPVNQLGLFPGVTQAGCKSVQILTPSRESLKYDIVESSEHKLRLARVALDDGALPPYRREAFNDRTQAQGYTIEWIDNQTLKLTTAYNTVDVLCDSKATPLFTITKMIYWAPTAAQLPSVFEVDPGFLKLAREGKGMEVLPPPEAPVDSPTSSAPVPEAPAPAPSPASEAPTPSPEPVDPASSPEEPLPGEIVGELRATATAPRGNISAREFNELVDHKVRDEVLRCRP